MSEIGAVALTSGRIALAPFDESCIGENYLEWLRDPEVVRFSNQRFRTHSGESARHYLESFVGSDNLFLAIRLAHDGRLIGTITAYVVPPHGTADMGMMIGDRSYWGRGYGLETWSTLMRHLLVARGLRKVTGGTVRPNAGMRIIMERSGMQLEAVRPRHEIVEGVEEDVLYYARFRDI